MHWPYFISDARLRVTSSASPNSGWSRPSVFPICPLGGPAIRRVWCSQFSPILITTARQSKRKEKTDQEFSVSLQYCIIKPKIINTAKMLSYRRIIKALSIIHLIEQLKSKFSYRMRRVSNRPGVSNLHTPGTIVTFTREKKNEQGNTNSEVVNSQFV